MPGIQDMLKGVASKKGINYDEWTENLKHKNQWHVGESASTAPPGQGRGGRGREGGMPLLPHSALQSASKSLGALLLTSLTRND